MDHLTRQQALNEAINAAHNAKVYARKAENAADNGDHQGRVPQLAAAAAAWADVSRSYTAIANALPEMQTGV
ncbi:hypothetical protein [Streptomyces canus]|uniref:hypothetical protein n=1 Tax=Streptomyces canus TaxID=58343 RepID=UPI00225A3B55|nr:hypothetical protein [Streptomyces canus]MCX4858964.1 hypothetical protein [Streptomyces canus]